MKVIVFDTETKSFVAHDVPDDTASIWCTYVPELNEVVFFPYGNKTTKLLFGREKAGVSRRSIREGA